MYFLYINILILTWFNFTKALGINGIGDGYDQLLENLNITLPSLRVQRKSIVQPLDHFNGNEKRTWSMTYYEALEFWQSGGPIYLFIGGEGRASERFIQTGIIYDLAKETNGALFLSEHRFYGLSQPFSNFNKKNLAYLSSRQALADLEKLLKEIKAKRTNSKIVVVGGSYPGNLAAWMRLLYPTLVDAAISSSGPVLAKKDFYEYAETVGNDYKQYVSPQCYSKISKKFTRYDKLFQTAEGIEQLKREENICDVIDMSKLVNRQTFFFLKIVPYMYSAQNGDLVGMKKLCEENGVDDRATESLLQKMGLIDKTSGCYNYDFTAMVNSYTPDTLAWVYQTCTEFGYFQSTASKNQPFTNNIPVDFYYKICSQAFGPEFNEQRVDKGIERTNNMYGGLTPKVGKVVFVHGDMDPWHRLGIVKDLSGDAPARLLHDYAHCKDLFPSPHDSDEKKKVTNFVKQTIKKWIGYS